MDDRRLFMDKDNNLFVFYPRTACCYPVPQLPDVVYIRILGTKLYCEMRRNVDKGFKIPKNVIAEMWYDSKTQKHMFLLSKKETFWGYLKKLIGLK